jgi:hypothetical protein
MTNIILSENIENRIFLIRGQKVMIDRDLAELYGVETKYLNRQVKRNTERFPKEFMFQLNEKERNELVTNWHRFNSLKHSATLPYAFTEYGTVMLASVLNSDQAIKVSILVTQTFVKIREIVSTNKEIENKIKTLEKKLTNHDKDIVALFNAIKHLLNNKEKPRTKIGYIK